MKVFSNAIYSFLFRVFQERERRRQHMILMKQLESKKRTDDMNRKREEMRIVRERDYEIKLEQKRLELEIMTEMRRPLEDMSLTDHKDLPELKRIPNLKLSGEGFANTLMVYEFLHNFGETLGFGKEQSNFLILSGNITIRYFLLLT